MKSLEAAVHRSLPGEFCWFEWTRRMNRSINLCIQRSLLSFVLGAFCFFGFLLSWFRSFRLDEILRCGTGASGLEKGVQRMGDFLGTLWDILLSLMEGDPGGS